jgi:sulfur-oxidizing protein SoxY
VTVSRRAVLIQASGMLGLSALPAAATRDERDRAVQRFSGGAAVQTGRVVLDLPALVENGNAAPLTVTVESPMTEAEHVRRIAVFNEANPQPNVFVATLGPRSGRARLSTRIRLGGSQRIVAVAEMSDGSFWQGSADVIVTLAACVEG